MTKIMCDAMNRDLLNVIGGGLKMAPVQSSAQEPKCHMETSVPNVADILTSAKEVLIVPGCGIAAARAQRSGSDRDTLS